MGRIATWLGDVHGLAVVAGDFNATRDHKQFRDILDAGLRRRRDAGGRRVAADLSRPTAGASRCSSPSTTSSCKAGSWPPTVTRLDIPDTDHAGLVATLMVPPAGFGRRHQVARSRGDRRATTSDHEGPRAGHRRQRLHRRAPRARAAARRLDGPGDGPHEDPAARRTVGGRRGDRRRRRHRPRQPPRGARRRRRRLLPRALDRRQARVRGRGSAGGHDVRRAGQGAPASGASSTSAA